jgi:RNA polymerase sigma factor (sigma-70 family)
MEINKDNTPNKEFSQKALEDFKLIDLALEGDEHAFAELMKRYKRSVYHVILKMIRNVDDAEDLTIEAFAKAFKNLSKFKKDFTFSTWLFRIATNNCIDFIRKKKLNTMSIESSYRDEDGDSVAMDVQDRELGPQDEVIKSQKEEIIKDVVSKLPARYQLLVKLRYFQELSYEEIADQINAPLGTVKAQLHRAKELLYELVKGKEDLI